MFLRRPAQPGGIRDRTRRSAQRAGGSAQGGLPLIQATAGDKGDQAGVLERGLMRQSLRLGLNPEEGVVAKASHQKGGEQRDRDEDLQLDGGPPAPHSRIL